jgi:hypothetical protein
VSVRGRVRLPQAGRTFFTRSVAIPPPPLLPAGIVTITPAGPLAAALSGVAGGPQIAVTFTQQAATAQQLSQGGAPTTVWEPPPPLALHPAGPEPMEPPPTVAFHPAAPAVITTSL